MVTRPADVPPDTAQTDLEDHLEEEEQPAQLPRRAARGLADTEPSEDVISFLDDLGTETGLRLQINRKPLGSTRYKYVTAIGLPEESAELPELIKRDYGPGDYLVRLVGSKAKLQALQAAGKKTSKAFSIDDERPAAASSAPAPASGVDQVMILRELLQELRAQRAAPAVGITDPIALFTAMQTASAAQMATLVEMFKSAQPAAGAPAPAAPLGGLVETITAVRELFDLFADMRGSGGGSSATDAALLKMVDPLAATLTDALAARRERAAAAAASAPAQLPPGGQDVTPAAPQKTLSALELLETRAGEVHLAQKNGGDPFATANYYLSIISGLDDQVRALVGQYGAELVFSQLLKRHPEMAVDAEWARQFFDALLEEEEEEETPQ